MNLGPRLNTRYNESAPTLSPSGKTLFFSSDRPGGFGHYDLYFSRNNGYLWGKPENLGAPFNSSRDEEYISLTRDGLWAYFASDRRNLEAKGRFDIYRAAVPERLREPVGILFSALILDGRSRLPLGVEATVKIHYEKETKVGRSRVFQKTPPSEIYSNYDVTLDSGRAYTVEFSAPGFYPG